MAKKLHEPWNVLATFITLHIKDAILKKLWSSRPLIVNDHQIQKLVDFNSDLLTKRYQLITGKLKSFRSRNIKNWIYLNRTFEYHWSQMRNNIILISFNSASNLSPLIQGFNSPNKRRKIACTIQNFF